MSLAAALLVVAPAAVAAQDADAGCDPPHILRGPFEVFPASGSSGVTLLAPIRVRYHGALPDQPEMAFVLRNSENGTQVAGDVQLIGDELIFVPSAPLSPSTRYE